MRERGDILVIDLRSGVDSYMFSSQEEMQILCFFDLFGSTDYQQLFYQFLHLNEEGTSLREKRFRHMLTFSCCSAFEDDCDSCETFSCNSC